MIYIYIYFFFFFGNGLIDDIIASAGPIQISKFPEPCCVAMLPVTEGLLIAVLGTHLVLLVFVVWQITLCLRRVALYIRRARWLVIGKMDCDELIDKLMSVADPQGADAGPAEGAPPAAAPAAMPDTSQGGRTGAKTSRTASPPIKSTL